MLLNQGILQCQPRQVVDTYKYDSDIVDRQPKATPPARPDSEVCHALVILRIAESLQIAAAA
jgi:hypothetical protein